MRCGGRGLTEKTWLKKWRNYVHIKQLLSVFWSKSGTQLGKKCIISFHFADEMTQWGRLSLWVLFEFQFMCVNFEVMQMLCTPKQTKFTSSMCTHLTRIHRSLILHYTYFCPIKCSKRRMSLAQYQLNLTEESSCQVISLSLALN